MDGSTSYMITANNRLQSDGTYLYQYDAEGNRTVRTQIATGDFTVYEWDHRNRLVKVSEYNGSVTLLQTVEHTYDPFNQWVTRSVDPDGQTGSAALEKTVFVHEGGQIVLQFDKTGSGDAAASDLSHRYLWGPAVDQLLADEAVGSLTSAGEVLWPLADHLGTVRDVVDTAGMVRKHVAYDSFGRIEDEQFFDKSGAAIADPSTHAEAIDQLFYFTGRALDESTGLQNNLNRWYDPAVGRWISDDPICFAAGDTNLARYVGNEATVSLDSNGLADYRKRFRDETPTMPSDWKVHHTLQQKLRDRYLLERGIDVDAPAYCRGVDPRVHSEITTIQNRFRDAMRREFGPNFWSEMPLERMDELVEQIDSQFGHLWIEAGTSLEGVEQVQGNIRRETVLGRGNRITRVLRGVGIGLGAFAIFAFIGENATLANNLANPDPNVQHAFSQFLDQYRYCLNEAIDKGRISQRRFGVLHESLGNWMDAVGIPENTQSIINAGFLKEWALLNP